MSYVTGQANSMADLLTTITDVCAAAGWAWHATAGTLVKTGCAVKLVADATSLKIYGGTGVDGSNALINPSPSFAQFYSGVKSEFTFTWPVTYHIHTHSDPVSVVVTINYDVGWWMHMIFGNAINLGCPGDGGNVPFYWASICSRTDSYYGNLRRNLGCPFNNGAGGNQDCVPFGKSNIQVTATNETNGGAYVALPAGFAGNADDPIGWTCAATRTLYGTYDYFNYPFSYSPNAWNGAAHLIRFIVRMARPSGLACPLFELPNVRLIRNNYYEDGDIKTEGSDNWRIFPLGKKDTINPYAWANTNIGGSGTMALAIKVES